MCRRHGFMSCHRYPLWQRYHSNCRVALLQPVRGVMRAGIR
jgi:hypothetical protein